MYLDDILVKFIKDVDHVWDLRVLGRYRMNLNPQKCAFGVGLGKFLGFMITNRGTEVNLEKIQAKMNMKESET